MSVYNTVNCSNFIIGGDLSTSFDRMSLVFMKHLNDICEHESCKSYIDFEGNTICYTFSSAVDNDTHINDHVLLNNGFLTIC